ncbi:putative thyroid hormone receptor binding [Lyophyllum shimeji]|uniref:Thyroid hormone receptor binding n=1 Tax=Lyophyllum shimeji TaxID=47721 RepID=A0A9P3PZI4_LYOSH|nr:putative thyroid hormone receptor binding [Lyophyllum shimeji]
MASHSPQRARRPPVHPVPQGSMHNLRETSRSPSLRARSGKTHSMPIVPTAMQIFNAAQPSSQTQQQPSPTSSINSRRSPPTGVTVQRLLPTPPHPPPNVQDANQDRHVSPPLPPQHAHNAPNPHYPRPVHRGPPPQFLAKYQNMEQESWEMTEELLAEIERADMQHAQAQSNSANAYPAGYPQNQQNNASPKDPAVERQEQRRQQAARESPKARERPSQTRRRPLHSRSRRLKHLSTKHRLIRVRLALLGSPQLQDTCSIPASPATIRRASNPLTTDSRQPIPSLATQTPPLQAITARTPDRSLPVQEEVEDEPGVASKNGTGARDAWQDNDDAPQHVRPTGSSPTPSSDLNPEGAFNDDHAGDDGSTRPGHRDDKNASVQHEDSQHRYSDRDRDHLEDEGGYTPRSPTAELPEHPPAKYYQAQNTNARPPQPQPARRHARNGSTDQLGLRTLDPSVFEGDQSVLVMGSEQLPPQYAEQRRQTQPPPQSQQYHNAQQYSQAQYHSSQMQPDNMEQYDSSYLQSYLHSPRPDAPIPPTPHSQTAAPSPSPLLSGNYGVGGKDLPPFSPVAPVGSPYPYPFTHVRRTQTFSGPHPNRPQVPGAFNAAELSTIQQQMIKQWQVYAQNHHAGNVTDSTLSPSSTPFPGGGAYNPWAFLHTKRTLGIQDTLSSARARAMSPLRSRRRRR